MLALFAFLGNFGETYGGNRHNVAWQFADTVLGDLSWQNKFHGLCAVRGDGGGGKTWFLKPQTYMNNSGESVGSLARFYKIEPRDILVVHDELELPFGTVSLKWSGGLGGHNGLRSVTAALGTRDFWRIRFGIGRPPHDDVAGYVLSDFLPPERDALGGVFALAGELFRKLLVQEPGPLLAEWAKKKVSLE
ncbi:MAG: aminoacyl-tRNA hydrolase [Spirochaetaceae bacterium]|jgi:PTH1 family peptidyl-tRNA hydrolase|nr:aminoacyl-tRNA hydrolase [Spirochaetaceae bacterium]